jgi:hypothetical protein
VQKLGIDANHRADKDSRVRSVKAAWSRCMTGMGYDYRSPMDASDDPSFGGDKISEREIATATADVRCKTQVGLVSTWAAVESAYQERLIGKNAVQLNLIRRQVETELKNAAKVSAG